MKTRIFLAAVTLVLLAGCAGPQTITIPRDSFQFKGDVQPMVSSPDALSGNFANLSPGETIVVAIANDGSGALSQPTLASVDVVETILTNRAHECDATIERCDTDGDGVWDRYCPDLLLLLNRCDALRNEKFVSFQSWYLISKDKEINEDYWKDSEKIDIAEEERQQVPFNLKMLTINRGNKPFTGRLTIYSQLPPEVEFLEIGEVTKVKDNREFKSNLGIIEGLFLMPRGLIASMIDDYGSVESDAEFTTEPTSDKKIRVTAKNITLNPGEGIRLGYAVNYKIQN